MKRTPRMKDVANAAGVSPMTVSRAFKQDASVSAETRARILKIADDLGYIFDVTAATLRSKKTGYVAVVIPSINNANFADTVGAMSERLSEGNLQTLLGYTNYSVDLEEEVIEQFIQRRPEAIVVTGGRHTDKARKLLSNVQVPVIEMWDLPSTPINHVVGFSNAEAISLMVNHLVDDGRMRIAFIGGDSVDDTRGAARRLGFVDALRARGLPADRLIAAGQTPVSMREGADAMTTLLQTFPDTDAVICVSDLSAFGALSECQRCGVSVPGDIAIAGFGNYEISAISHPTISTIDAGAHEIGRRCADLILDLTSKDERPPAEARAKGTQTVIRIQPKLTIRQSTTRL